MKRQQSKWEDGYKPVITGYITTSDGNKYIVRLWKRHSHAVTTGQFTVWRNGVILFDDDGYQPAPYSDAAKALQSLMAFIALSPDDTSEDYFKDYTADQMQFAESDDCKELQLMTYEDNPMRFSRRIWH
jgi:hypothetical protein